MPYYLPSKLSDVFSRFESLGQLQPGAKQGIATSDDFRFVRAKWEILGNFYENGWVLHTKGGEFSPYYVDVDFLLNWVSNGAEVKAFAERLTEERFGAPSWSRWINAVEYYFRPGLTFTYRSRRFGVGVMPPGVVFGVTGMGVFIDGNKDDHLDAMAVMNSSPFNFLLFMLCERRDPLFQAGKINSVPWPSRDSSGELRKLAESGYHGSVHNHSIAENSPFFNGPFYKTTSIKHSINSFAADEKKLIAEIVTGWAERQKKIDHIVAKLYGIDESAFDTLRAELAVFLGDNNHDYLGSPTARTKDELSVSVISYLLGCCFGRWDIVLAIGEEPAPELPDPFAPLPVCPPGMLKDSGGLPAKPEDIPPDYPLRISWDGILVDDPGFNSTQPHRDDIIRSVRKAVYLLWKDKAHEIEQEACDILGVPDLREYLRSPSGFFQDHLKRYSKSRRKAPIYWQLSTPSCTYAVWLYYHRFTKDTFYKILNDYVTPKLMEEERRLTRFRQNAGPNATSNQRKEITVQESFVDELRTFRDEIARIAPLWDPNLNDGVIINFAPLWRLVPHHRQWQKECKDCWDKLVKGDYDWAHLAMHLWPERVVPSCATDRSLAIAHGLEETFWAEGKVGKWQPKQVSPEELEKLIRERTSLTVKAALNDLLTAPIQSARAGGSMATRRRRTVQS